MATKTEIKRNLSVSTIVMAILAIIGIVAWITQLRQGLRVTGLNNTVVWGLYIIGFMMMTGVAASTLLFSSSTILFKGMSEFRPYAGLSVFIGAICAVVAAGFFIIVDVGNPERAWAIITSPHVQSPLLWDTIILGSYGVIGILFTRMLIQAKTGERTESSLKLIAIIAFILGLAVTITSFVFSMWVARPLWNTPVQPISFLFAALITGFSLLIICFSALRRGNYIRMESQNIAKLGHMVAVFLGIEAIIIFSEVAIGLYNGAGEETRIISWLVTGDGAVFFWLEIVTIALGLLLLTKKSLFSMLAGSSLALIAVFFIKYNLLQAQLLNPLINFAGPQGYGITSGVYFPSLIEMGVTIGIVAIGGLLVNVGIKTLPLGSAQ